MVQREYLSSDLQAAFPKRKAKESDIGYASLFLQHLNQRNLSSFIVIL
jgi:hypothetical protein